MILVDGKSDDYAIMKQVHQLRLRHAKMEIGRLEKTTKLDNHDLTEELYLVAHGDSDNGELLETETDLLVEVLNSLPKKFGGSIVILSCYSGLERVELTEDEGESEFEKSGLSLAGFLAQKLAGRVGSGVKVKGVKGYAFGTPNLKDAGLSSVLPMNLDHIYNIGDPSSTTIKKAIGQWLKCKPTHTGGVLKDKLNVEVKTDRDIGSYFKESDCVKNPDLDVEYPDPVEDIFERFKKAVDELRRHIHDDSAIGRVVRSEGTDVVEIANYLIALECIGDAVDEVEDLKDYLKDRIDKGKTGGDKAVAAVSDLVAFKYVVEFGKEVRMIEDGLKESIEHISKKVNGGGGGSKAGNSEVEKVVKYIVEHENLGKDDNDYDEDVATWEKLIKKQYELYRYHYMWAKEGDDFATFEVKEKEPGDASRSKSGA